MEQETFKKFIRILKINGIIIFYFLQIFFICMYIQTDIQPFIYVRF